MDCAVKNRHHHTGITILVHSRWRSTVMNMDIKTVVYIRHSGIKMEVYNRYMNISMVITSVSVVNLLLVQGHHY